MSGLTAFTLFHTALSLVALITGLVVVYELFASKISRRWTEIFLITAVATSVTGFMFPFTQVLPSHIVGAIALVVLAAAIIARHQGYMGTMRWIYAIGSVVSLYFLAFVTVAQAFAKIPALKALAPTQSEPPFAIAQLTLTVIFVGIAIAAAIKFRPAPPVIA
jgi:hypothetical protein